MTKLFDFESPASEGSGQDLPLILGLKSVTEKSGVMEMKEDKRMLTFPGPGGYEIRWVPGATRIPLQDAMLKHSMIPRARFHNRTPKPKQGGLPSRKMTSHATSTDNHKIGITL